MNNNINNQINKNYNGRVIFNQKPSKSFDLYSENNSSNEIYQQEAVKTIQSESLLSKTFFSKQNIDIIQNNLRYKIWIQSQKKHLISRQSDIQLQIIMRSIFLQNAKHLPNNIKEQIINLNLLVEKYCIPKILSEISQYIAFKNDVSSLPKPINRPLKTSIKGEKTLELKNFM